LQVEIEQLQVDNKQTRVEIEQLQVDNKQLQVDNKQLQVDNKQLQVENKQVSSYVEVLMAERKDKRNVMAFRQLATSYQFRAATILDHPSKPEQRFMLTHAVLRKAKTTDSSVMLELESRFSTRDSQLTGEEIENKIKLIRGTGVSTSHPTKLLAADGSEYTPTAQDLEDLVHDLCDRELVMPALRSCAMALLDNIVSTASHPIVQSLVGTDLLKSFP
jgi:hypothetical protein